MQRATTRSAQDATIALAAVAALLAADLPSVGADGWRFAAGHVDPQGPLGWLVELARVACHVGDADQPPAVAGWVSEAAAPLSSP